jgi:hypothetical protein
MDMFIASFHLLPHLIFETLMDEEQVQALIQAAPGIRNGNVSNI